MKSEKRNQKKKIIAIIIALVLACSCIAAVVIANTNDANYVIRFDSGDGSAVASISIDGKSEIKFPENPTKSGYSFGGWFVDNVTFLVKFDLAYIKANGADKTILVYAKWIENGEIPPEDGTFTVTFNANGGTGSFERITGVKSGDKIKAPKDPTRIFYAFMGWYKDQALTTLFDFDKEVITSNITLYAKWRETYTSSSIDKEVRYTVTFVTNGGAPVPSQSVLINEKATEPTAPTKPNNNLGGWFTEAGLINAYNFNTPVTSNITLYAKWAEWTVESAFDFTEIKVHDVVVAYSIAQNTTTQPTGDVVLPRTYNNIPVTSIKEDGFKDNTGITSINIPNSVNIIAQNAFSGNTALTNVYIPNSVTVVGNSAFSGCAALNSINIPNSVTSISANAFAGCAALTNVYIPSSVTNIGANAFSGWTNAQIIIVERDSKPDGWDASWSGAATVKWTLTVTYNTNGGEGSFPSIKVLTGDSIIEPTAPTKAGFTFDGWYREADFITKFIFGTDKINANIQLHAKWTLTVRFVLEDGTEVSSQNVMSNSKATAPVLTNPSNNLNGWYTEAGLINAFNFDTPIRSNITLYAKWLQWTVDALFEFTTTDNGNTYSISQNPANQLTGDVVLPSTHNDKPVVAIKDDGFKDNTDITSMFIPKSVTSIPTNGFSGCTNLKTVTIPTDSEMTEIGINAFANCTSLTSFVTPRGVTKILGSAFLGCTSMKTIIIPSSVTTFGTLVFEGWTDEQTIIVKRESKPDDWANDWNGNAKIKWTLIVTYDANGVAGEYPSMEVLTGDSIIEPTAPTSTNLKFAGWFIDNGTFANKFDFTTKIQSSITLFAKWTAIVTFNNDGNTTDIPKLEVTYNESATAPTEPTKTGYKFDGWFTESGFTNKFVFGTTKVTEHTTLYVKWLQWTGDSFFEFTSTGGGHTYSIAQKIDNKPTGDVVLPSTYNNLPVTTIAVDGFKENTAITSMIIPNSVTSIGASAFSGCTLLGKALANKFTIPSSVATMGGKIFEGWTDEQTINIDLYVQPNTGWDVSWNSGAAVVVWKDLNELYMFTLINNNNDYSIAQKSTTIPSGEIVLPSFYNNKSVTTIAVDGFKDNTAITSVTIPSSVKTIGASAFDGCTALVKTNFTTLSSVTSIGNYAFRGCTALGKDPANKFTIPSSVATMGEKVFEGWTDTQTINIDLYEQPAGWDTGWNSGVANVEWKDLNELFTFTLINNNNEYSIAKKDNAIPSGEIVLPSSYKDKQVTAIATNGFLNNKAITSVTIPSSVTSIGDQAFSGCTSLTNATIPSSVTDIGNYAFRGCTSLGKEDANDFKIPSSVTKMGLLVFDGWTTEQTINIGLSVKPAGWGSNWINGSKADVIWLDHFTFTEIKNGDDIIEYSIAQKSTAIPSGVIVLPSSYNNLPVTTIAVDGFKDNTAITSVKIPDSVKTIGLSAFSGCTSLTNATIPESVTSIGDQAFFNCTALGKTNALIIPSSATTMGQKVFSGWTDAQKIHIHLSVQPAGWQNGWNDGNAVVIWLDQFTFTEIKNGNDIIAYSIGEISNMIPSGEIVLPSSYKGKLVTTIADGGFKDNTAITSVTIPSSVKSIGGYAFAYCTVLNSVTIPDSVTRIGNYAFVDCTALGTTSNFTIPSSVVTMDNNVFNGWRAAQTIHIELYEKPTAGWSSSWKGGSAREVWFTPSANFIFTAIDGVDAYSIKQNPDNKPSGVISLPNTYKSKPVTSIVLQGFLSNTAITSVKIPSSMTSIGNQAFYGCTSLNSITIPSSVTSIGEGAFAFCTALGKANSFTIPKSVVAMDANVFYSWTSAQKVNVPFANGAQPTGWDSRWYDNSSATIVYKT